MDLLTEDYHWKIFKTLLSSEPVLQILKLNLIGKIQGPISAPATESNTLEGINGIIQLLRMHDSPRRCSKRRNYWTEKDQLIRECRLLYEGLIPLTGEYKNEDQAIPSIADAPGRSFKDGYKHENQAFLSIADAPRGYHTGPSEYASAESEIESDELIGIQQMALVPSGAPPLRDVMVRIKDESRSAAACVREDVSPSIPGPLQTYLKAAMRRCFSRSNVTKPARQYIQDIL